MSFATETSRTPVIANCEPISLADVPVLPFEEFRDLLAVRVGPAEPLSALFGRPLEQGKVRLYAVLSKPAESTLTVAATDVSERYPSLTPDCSQAHWFEREIAEQWGLIPDGHPWFKPIRFHHSYLPGHDAWGRADDAEILPCVTDFFRVEGSEIHEVAVGPVHAGVIEPGHFRFQCHGEHVFHLEVSLGFQHRGIERQLIGGPNKRTIHYMETLAGDTSIGHATAYCQAVEALAGVEPPIRAQALRGISLELERLANHTGDLGALAGDVGFLPTASYCGRLRGDFLNSSAAICGNRFGRDMVRPGGVLWDVDPARADELIGKLKAAIRDVGGAADLLFQSSSAMARFEGTCSVSRQVCEALGLVGYVARGCGVDRDVRHDFPTGIFRYVQIPVSAVPSGDVFARAFIRYLEIQRSGKFVLDQLASLPSGKIRHESGALAPSSLVVSLVEGWRGEICHVALTDDQGKFAHYKVVDPSFHNWVGMSMALRDQQISDFPLCNKSFNQSYCGHDL